MLNFFSDTENDFVHSLSIIIIKAGIEIVFIATL